MSQTTELSKMTAEEINGRYLSFSLGQENFAMPLLVVKEVVALLDITPIPQSPAYLLGIINLRGKVITVYDLRLKLGIKPENGKENAIIICEYENGCFGVLVDSVNMVLAPKHEELSPPPGAEGTCGHITGVYRKDKNMTLLIDIFAAIDMPRASAA